jgi:hypothetical protein
MGYTIESDLASALPFPLLPVPVVALDDPADFHRGVGRTATPAVISGAIDQWPALARWHDPSRLVELVGSSTTVFCRQVADASEPYREEYEEVRFADLITEVFERGSTAHYLTQALVIEPEGLLRRVVRTTYPALLQQLAVDAGVPPVLRNDEVVEGVMWMGVGAPTTPLHFDDTDNLNCLVRGRKRWVIFPTSETRHLLIDGQTGRGSVLSSLEQLTADGEWRGGPVRHAYVCETGPGDVLFVPGGFAHQVFSSREPSIAINFWFADPTSLRTIARLVRTNSLRRCGFGRPMKRIAWMAVLVTVAAGVTLRYRLRPSSMPEPEIRLGPTSYDSAVGI